MMNCNASQKSAWKIKKQTISKLYIIWTIYNKWVIKSIGVIIYEMCWYSCTRNKNTDYQKGRWFSHHRRWFINGCKRKRRIWIQGQGHCCNHRSCCRNFRRKLCDRGWRCKGFTGKVPIQKHRSRESDFKQKPIFNHPQGYRKRNG